MDILQSIIIGAIGCIIGPKIQRYIEKKIKLKWLCWILTFIITIIILQYGIKDDHELMSKYPLHRLIPE